MDEKELFIMKTVHTGEIKFHAESDLKIHYEIGLAYRKKEQRSHYSPNELRFKFWA